MSHFSLWTVARRSSLYFFRSNLALVLGFSAATAVLVGALVVGDSVSGSLHKVVTDRLANIECLLQARTFFNPQILADLTTEVGESTMVDSTIVPGILFSSATVEHRAEQGVTRASKVQVLAFEPRFWEQVQIRGPALQLGEDEVAMNQSLATELQVAVGDEISIRVRELISVPGDNPLGERDDSSVNVPRQKLAAILPDDSVGGVSFLAGQASARNVFLSLVTLQDVLDVGSQVNAAIVLRAGDATTGLETSQQWCDALNLQLTPSLEDYGLKLERHRRVYPDPDLDQPPTEGLPPEVIYDYLQLSSQELILEDATSRAVVNRFGSDQATRLLTGLANALAKIEPPPVDSESQKPTAVNPVDGRGSAGEAEKPLFMPRAALVGAPESAAVISDLSLDLPLLSRRVPYSIVVGVERGSELDVPDYTQVASDRLKPSHCWINSWLAEQLDASAGDWLKLEFFEPETVDGREIEKAKRLMVAGIVPLTEPVSGYSRRRPATYGTAPTIFNDPGLTPTVPGVTDQESISNWDVPFKLVNPLEEEDDVYWENHRLTPKLFLPYELAASPGFFGSRFGSSTAIRFSRELSQRETQVRAGIEEALLETRSLKGLVFLPVRKQLLTGAAGTTPFDQLFLALSFFVIVAALLLVFLLFKLALERRGSELGILLAQGFPPARVRRLVLIEMSLIGMLGAGLGIGLGLAYARAMIAGLESWWVGAISTRFLTFFADSGSLVIGACAGFFTGLLAVYLAMRRASRLNALSVLRGRTDGNDDQHPKRLGQIALGIAGFTALAAGGLIILAFSQTGMARAGSFFGSGMLLLMACLATFRFFIEQSRLGHHSMVGGSRGLLAWRAVCRNPTRSSLALGLLAVAAFLIASMSVFQMTPTEKGYGGFNFVAETSQPVYRNIGSSSVRRELLGNAAEALESTIIVPMRSRNGEDASCNNLFQVAQPTVIGVPLLLEELHALNPDGVEFEWSRAENPDAPWAALNSAAKGTETDPIPVILDQNTADWSLKQGGSLRALTRIEFDEGPVYFRTVGLLANSIFQGKLLINLDNFETLFPKIGGYNFFLIRSAESQEPRQVAQALEEGWSTEGMDVMYSAQVLERFLGVQNTYISAFQSLGALGLLLGTFGLIAVQLRSVLERRREFALMRAVGFTPHTIAQLLTIETAILLGGGLVIGTLCASAALVPYVLEVGPKLSVFNSLLMLVVVLLAGFLAALIAVRAASKQSVLEGLRTE
jgi:putative ABC transport system permease protein